MVKEISCVDAEVEGYESLIRSETEEEVIEFAGRHAEETRN